MIASIIAKGISIFTALALIAAGLILLTPATSAQAHEPQDCQRVCDAGADQVPGAYLATDVPAETGMGVAAKIFVVILVILGTAAFALVMAHCGPKTEHTGGSCPEPKMTPAPHGLIGIRCSHPAR